MILFGIEKRFYFTAALLIIAGCTLSVFGEGSKKELISNHIKLLKGPLSALNKKPKDKPKQIGRPKYIRGIHLTPWTAGSRKAKERINKMLDETELNAVVIAIKEVAGEVYIGGVKSAEELNTNASRIPGLRKYVRELKEKNYYTIARVVIFKDDLLARIKPEWAVRDSSGAVWQDYSGYAWIDPFDKASWEYNLDISLQAVKLGFDEIQFDYIRFPSDGRISDCRYDQVFTSTSGVSALVEFLKKARKQINAAGAKFSIDVFGLATTNLHDMGIGQKIVEMTECVDYVSPMVYPSHYYKTTYGIDNPNKEPYLTVYLSLQGAKKRLGDSFKKLRPYLQDFSLGHPYGHKEVRAQIQACYDNDIPEWLLWDPTCKYTREALKGPEFSDVYEKSEIPIPLIKKTTEQIKRAK